MLRHYPRPNKAVGRKKTNPDQSARGQCHEGSWGLEWGGSRQWSSLFATRDASGYDGPKRKPPVNGHIIRWYGSWAFTQEDCEAQSDDRCTQRLDGFSSRQTVRSGLFVCLLGAHIFWTIGERQIIVLERAPKLPVDRFLVVAATFPRQKCEDDEGWDCRQYCGARSARVCSARPHNSVLARATVVVDHHFLY